MQRKCYAVIVAGGSGSRMGGEIAKQFLMLGDKPILLHTIEAFLSLSFPVEIILVVPASLRDYWKNFYKEQRLSFKHTLVSGGITRFHSVKNAMKYVPEGALVAVHDGVRPFVPKDFLESLFAEAEEKRAVIPAVKVVDSLRYSDENGSRPVERDKYVSIQTPQIFHSELLLDAYNQAYNPAFTDDASVVESRGTKIYLTEGRMLNIKITRPEDLTLAQAILISF
ncbi:MAG: 2-C-methyl-D-erythritol 4-phosphate cytidylyltransferase [Bacteroidales bacterium]|mgnify:CR=1 FL=1|jgi:2-C-methyl-D-erythritol 4-phosphate cytidylyltransferase|nr:2-C-methyl-D-erythritol 4-phosphate cytidylyltransferase [Bacteroidales bacterium]HNW48089.1 2-C-methyl-D-erythritol 4-phosphate cytidylyltransferase [Bacteroidales bacterium]HPS95353.1 2-C-methyl-D-erythritol 4-phosphate cytidylyltransferase [Bacteroidales bacterium]